ncbi:methyltransferase domain-containing protein [Lancefieldella parvula]|uniref:class I SAM-dependent methyltransferase n=1 Tax=Lancefieldella parvula TaxID=1382 RepID=UPI0028ED731E|nr:methyltransferase domain-containing protein [Lancefieldella parvula]
MKPDYKNWFPKGMVYGFFAGTTICLALFFIVLFVDFIPMKSFQTMLVLVFGVLSVIMIVISIWGFKMYQAFSYDGKRQMSRQIIEGVASYITIPAGGKGLDVGCGSGALAIAVAKKNPGAMIVGIDRWGKEYASFSKTLCENNAKAESVTNTSFFPGDAVNLNFEDESFDAVFSNYVYHNIPSSNRQEILLETLRTLKKGGVFAIHDIFSQNKYGDMNAFLATLKSMGYESVELIDTTEGMFMTPKEAKWMMLSGSALLVGRK